MTPCAACVAPWLRARVAADEAARHERRVVRVASVIALATLCALALWAWAV